MQPNTCTIETDRFILRSISLSDVNETYLNWLEQPESKRFIISSKKSNSLESLRNYVAEKIGKQDCLFLAIIDKATEAHIGNIKYEPINFEECVAEMGILIGQKNWRGKGVFLEVFRASEKYLIEQYNIERVKLGVKVTNEAALKAYDKVGFKKIYSKIEDGVEVLFMEVLCGD